MVLKRIQGVWNLLLDYFMGHADRITTWLLFWSNWPCLRPLINALGIVRVDPARQNMRTWLSFVRFSYRFTFKLNSCRCIHFLQHCNYFSSQPFRKTGLQDLDKWIWPFGLWSLWTCRKESTGFISILKKGWIEGSKTRGATQAWQLCYLFPPLLQGRMEVQNHCHRWSKRRSLLVAWKVVGLVTTDTQAPKAVTNVQVS